MITQGSNKPGVRLAGSRCLRRDLTDLIRLRGFQPDLRANRRELSVRWHTSDMANAPIPLDRDSAGRTGGPRDEPGTLTQRGPTSVLSGAASIDDDDRRRLIAVGRA